MAEKQTKEFARYLEKDGSVRLFGVDQLKDARADGWREPTGVRGNGLPWNEPVREGAGQPAAEAAATTTQQTEEMRSKLAEEDAAREAELVSARAADRVPLEERPDYRVEVVQSTSQQSDSGTASNRTATASTQSTSTAKKTPTKK